MKLPNYSDSKLWEKLRKQMGVDNVIDYKEAKYSGIKPDIFETLEKKGIEVESLDDVGTAQDGSFEYEGQKIIVYIKEQRTSRFGKSGYKYHISQCSTLIDMVAKQRFNVRYVQTTRRDGYFDVILDYGWRKEEETLKMDVCKNCLKVMQKSYSDKMFQYSFGRSPENFNIYNYFKKYSTTHTYLPPTKAKDYEENGYTDEWRNISRELREKANWICESCNKSFVNHKAKLHVHHKNGRRNDNREENLKVLCALCHSKEPGHGHMGSPKVTGVEVDDKINIKKDENDKGKGIGFILPEENKVKTIETTKVEQEPKSEEEVIVKQPIINDTLQKPIWAGISKDDIKSIIEKGESDKIEFKSTLKWHIHKKCDDREITEQVLKTITSFMNTQGGVLLVGVEDNGNVIGIDKSFKTSDKALTYFDDMFEKHILGCFQMFCKTEVVKYDDKEVIAITVEKADDGVFFQYQNPDKLSEFWVRASASKRQLDPAQVHPYITKHFT